jgi:hypothetical protein
MTVGNIPRKNAEQLSSGAAAQHFSPEYFQRSSSQQNSNIKTIIVTQAF